MNTLIVLNKKQKESTPPLPADQNVPEYSEQAKRERGAPMFSRPGKASKTIHTCFYRGTAGETGGKAYVNIKSDIKELMKKPQKESDLVLDPVSEQDIKMFLQVQDYQRELEEESGITSPDGKVKALGGKRGDKGDHVDATSGQGSKMRESKEVSKLSFTDEKPPIRENLYEKIAIDMRSKAARESIQFKLKMANATKMQGDEKKPGKTGSSSKSIAMRNKINSAVTSPSGGISRGSKQSQSLDQFSTKPPMGVAHEVWCPPGDDKLTYLQGAVLRNVAQYRELEKHARGVDFVHIYTYAAIDAKEKAVHLDD